MTLMNKIQLTQEGFDNLKKELDELQNVRRPATIEKLQKARAMGDLKENNAYQSAREELGDLDGRILEIQYILKDPAVVEKGNGDVVELGNSVSVIVDGEEKTLLIVGEHESDPMNGKISTTSPIGMALMGAKPGMTVAVATPAGTKSYKVTSIR